MRMNGLLSRLPASTSSTLTAGSSLSRLARTQPAEPAPTMMKSNSRMGDGFLSGAIETTAARDANLTYTRPGVQ